MAGDPGVGGRPGVGDPGHLGVGGLDPGLAHRALRHPLVRVAGRHEHRLHAAAARDDVVEQVGAQEQEVVVGVGDDIERRAGRTRERRPRGRLAGDPERIAAAATAATATAHSRGRPPSRSRRRSPDPLRPGASSCRRHASGPQGYESITLHPTSSPVPLCDERAHAARTRTSHHPLALTLAHTCATVNGRTTSYAAVAGFFERRSAEGCRQWSGLPRGGGELGVSPVVTRRPELERDSLPVACNSHPRRQTLLERLRPTPRRQPNLDQTIARLPKEL